MSSPGFSEVRFWDLVQGDPVPGGRVEAGHGRGVEGDTVHQLEVSIEVTWTNERPVLPSPVHPGEAQTLHPEHGGRVAVGNVDYLGWGSNFSLQLLHQLPATP